ncbi:MAG: hypothetical protein GF307_03960 [candidate division Zixibacteria bacterium]|nr:hypothetical protein [candidate division Zixibacteria bacterium]
MSNDYRVYLIPVLVYVFSAITYLFAASVITDQIGFPLDDSYIHAVFARSIAGGSWFEFNPGVPVAGSTAPLYTALVGLVYWFFGVNITMQVLLGEIINIAGLIYTIKMFKLLISDDDESVLLGGMLTALAFPLVWGSVSGMEIPLAFLLVSAGIYYHIKAINQNGGNQLSILLLSLALLTRPETAVIAVLLIIDRSFRIKTKRGTTLILNSIVYLSLPAIFGILNYHFTGTAFANTFLSKTQYGSLYQFLLFDRDPLRLVWSVIIAVALSGRTVFYLLFDNPVSVLFIAALAVNIPAFKSNKQWANIRLFLIILLIIPMAIGAATGWVFAGQYQRYISYILPLFFALHIVAFAHYSKVDRALEKITNLRSYPALKKPFFIAMLLISVLYILIAIDYPPVVNFLRTMDIRGGILASIVNSHLLLSFSRAIFAFTFFAAALIVFMNFYGKSLENRKRILKNSAVIYSIILMLVAGVRYGYNVDNINRMQVNIARWASEKLPADSVVAVNDIGAFGFYAPQRILDLQGLISTEILEYEGDIPAFFSEVETPGYMIIFRRQLGDYRDSPHLKELYSVKLLNNTICMYDDMVVFKITNWPSAKQ